MEVYGYADMLTGILRLFMTGSANELFSLISIASF